MTDVDRDKLRRVLEAEPRVRLAVLFGSAAKRALRSRSDIDVGVSFGGGDERAQDLSVAVSRATGRPVDLVLLDSAPPLLRLEIARDGSVLVEREPHLWAEFRAHAMIDWWDWAPTARIVHDAMSRRLREEASRGPS